MFIVLPKKKKKKTKIKFLKGPTHNLKPIDLISWTFTYCWLDPIEHG